MERRRAIANPEELDPSFSVPCRRCAELLQEGNRFCPFCFQDQLAPVAGNPEPVVERRVGLRAAAETSSPDGFDFMDTVQPDAQGVIQFPGPPGAMARMGPVGRRRVFGIVSALVLVALAFVALQHTHVDDRDASGRLRAFKADVERAQTALDRGDLSTAQQVLEGLKADHADDPGIRTLKAAFDRRVQEQTAQRVQPQLPPPPRPLPQPSPEPQAQPQPPPPPPPLQAARETFSALGLDESVAPPPALPPEAPPAVVSAPATGTAATAEGTACSEALAALALCQQK